MTAPEPKNCDGCGHWRGGHDRDGCRTISCRCTSAHGLIAPTAPEPTRPADEHIDAVARALLVQWAATSEKRTAQSPLDHCRDFSRAILTPTDPAVHLAMLDALVRAGVLTPEDAPIYRAAEHHHWQQRWDGQHTDEGRRLVTSWEVAP